MESHEVLKIVEDAIKKNNETQAPVIADAISGALEKHQQKQDEKAAEAQKVLDAEEAKKKADKDAELDKAKIVADAKASAELRQKLKPLMGDKFDDSKTDKELLVLTFADTHEKAEEKSVDYLLALLDAELQIREKGGTPHLDAANLATLGAVKVTAIK